LPAESFIDRFLHVVPPHVPRIRHVGVLANCAKEARLAQCRRLRDVRFPSASHSGQHGREFVDDLGVRLAPAAAGGEKATRAQTLARHHVFGVISCSKGG